MSQSLSAAAAAGTIPFGLRVALAVPLIPGGFHQIGTLSANTSFAEGIEVAVPFVAGRTCSLTQAGLTVTTAGGTGSLLRLGVRADDGTLKPGALVTDAGTQDTSSAGTKIWTPGSPLALGSLYWLTGTQQGNATGSVGVTSATLSSLLPATSMANAITNVPACLYATTAQPGALVAGVPGSWVNLTARGVPKFGLMAA
jgi:hypothetical protein